MSACVRCGRENHNCCDVCDRCREEIEQAEYWESIQQQEQEPQPDPEQE